MRQINCEIIQDLLPSYSDKISSNATNKLVEEHLQECAKCQEALNEMNKGVDVQPVDSQTEKIDYLKGFKKRRKLLIMLSIIMTVVVLVVIFLINIFNNNLIADIPLYVDVNDFNVEYMYIKENTGLNETTGETFKYTTLEVYLYAGEYENKYLTGQCIIEGERTNVYYDMALKRLPKGLEFDSSGIEISIIIEDIEDKINVERVYLRDTKNNSREIWNKDMKVQTEEEWRKWYIDQYVPKEVKEQYNMTYENIPVYTSVWKHLYNKNLKK